MYFALYCRDHEDALDLRMANREDHLAYVAGHIDMVKAAGPLLAEDGKTMVGSLLIMEGASLDEIKAWSASDPYVTGGVFQRVDINQMNWSFGAPET